MSSDVESVLRPEPRASVLGRDWDRLAIGVLLAYFAAKLLYLAFALAPGVPPDELTHLGRALAYSEVWGFPRSGESNWSLGLLVHRPFLYSWLMGRALAFNVLPLPDLVFLRLVNVAIAMGTVCYGLRWIRLVTASRLTHVVFCCLLTNTLMFTGIGAAVSYDNLTNLAAAAAIFHLFRFIDETTPADLAAFAAFTAAGCITKRSFLPLAAVLVAALVARAGRRLPEAARLLDVRSPATAIAVVLLLANGALYGSNLVLYQRLVPSFDQVVGVAAARQNRIFARDYALDGFREGRLTYDEALAAVEGIAHAGDRRATKLQLEQIRKKGDWRVGPARYTWLWGRIMLDRTVGYFGHRVLRRTSTELIAYAAVLALAIALHGVGWRRRRREVVSCAGAIALAYAAILLVFVNHPTYLEKGLLDAGVQGRYLFPVLIPLLGFVAYGLAVSPPRVLRSPLCIAACGLFLCGELPVFVLRTTSAWTVAAG